MADYDPTSRARSSDGEIGDKLVVVVRGDRVIVLQEPVSPHAAIRGIARGIYPADYLKKERQSWD